MKHDHELAAKLYARAVDPEAMRLRLPDLGDSLRDAALDLSHNFSLDNVDAFLCRLKGAETSLVHLRLSLAAKRQEGSA